MSSSLSRDIHFVTNYPLKYYRVIYISLINGSIISYFVFLSNCHECWLCFATKCITSNMVSGCSYTFYNEIAHPQR